MTNGGQDFRRRESSDITHLHRKTSLTKEQAVTKAKKFLDENFSEFASRTRLKFVWQTRSKLPGETEPSGQGYHVRFDVLSGNLPVWGNYVSVIIDGDEIEIVAFLYYDEQSEETLQKSTLVTPKDAGDCFFQSLPQIKENLNIMGKFEVIETELCYVNKAAAQGKDVDLNEDFVPAWRLKINRVYREKVGPRRGSVYHVWLDAITGEFIGKKLD